MENKVLKALEQIFFDPEGIYLVRPITERTYSVLTANHCTF